MLEVDEFSLKERLDAVYNSALQLAASSGATAVSLGLPVVYTSIFLQYSSGTTAVCLCDAVCAYPTTMLSI